MSATRKTGAGPAPSPRPVKISEAEEGSQALPEAAGAFSSLDRLGGLDGIFSLMGKIQQMFGFFMQMRPAFKMIGSFLGPKATVSSVQPMRPKHASRTANGRRPSKGARPAARVGTKAAAAKRKRPSK